MKRILVAIDYSEATPRVIDLSRQVATAFGSEIHLVHVKELAGPATPGTMGFGLAGMPELAPISGVPLPAFDIIPAASPKDEGEKSRLEEWKKEFEQSGLKVRSHELTGSVAEEILNQADAVNADLIVMGAHGHGAMYKLLVGSVTEGVLKRTKRPVLLLPSSRP